MFRKIIYKIKGIFSFEEQFLYRKLLEYYKKFQVFENIIFKNTENSKN